MIDLASLGQYKNNSGGHDTVTGISPEVIIQSQDLLRGAELYYCSIYGDKQTLEPLWGRIMEGRETL